MLRLLFILENMGCGGAERVLPNLLKYLNRTKYSITVLTLFSDGVNAGRLPGDVRHVCRHAPYFRGISFLVRILSPEFLYRYYVKSVFPNEEFDVYIAYMHGLPTKVVSAAPGQRMTWLHGSMAGGYTPTLRRNFISFAGMRKCLVGLDAIVGVSEAVCESFKQYTGLEKRVHLIHNTNDVEEIQSKASEPSPYHKDGERLELVTVGHLQKVKGNDRLLEAVLRLKEDGLDFHVTILGEGIERGALEEYITVHGLAEFVSMPGFKENPYPYIKNADIYVCPSRSEGFSTAVSEALILGVPVVSTRVSGAGEMLGDADEYGIVCENSPEGIYLGLKRMMTTQGLIEHYAEQSAKRSVLFEPERTVGDVEKLLDEIAGDK